MDLSQYNHLRFLGLHVNYAVFRCMALLVAAFVFTTVMLPSFSGFGGIVQHKSAIVHDLSSGSDSGMNRRRFIEVPQIVWGLNNQKIAFARACLTARMMNRTLLMPSLSASLFYKEIDLLKPISFDKVFKFEKFNSLCDGFVQLGRYSELSNRSDVVALDKGSGRKWTIDRDLDQLRQFSEDPYDAYETIKVVGKNPFLWQDHWPVSDYARVFECLVLVDEISNEADKVVSRIREIGREFNSKNESLQNGGSTESSSEPVPYVAVHMRIEKDWMIHCKKQEQRLHISEICSSKQEIMERVDSIVGFKRPIVIYLAVADSLLEDNSILEGWKEGLLPFEKKKLGVEEIYKKHSYLIQSAIDYEVCLRASVFVGNSFSTFSSLVVLERTQKMIRIGTSSPCSTSARWPSYAYNIQTDSKDKDPQRWMTNMSDTSLLAISYGSNHTSC
ncbi:O-fucosyltransferase family protein [Heracleum sosnowskyi]|uniref:O-fucosyltransferase family protein n=1 Tax=Heracleum sosnowskyi TaxID=360622 RepID=A0AAD8HM73_9APIA|nr:O-fucosyltransferase family protein [Heracleum sosnowskyi]